MEEKLDTILAFAEIGDFIHQPLKTYSSGMKARLGFSVAVHTDPEILILDEVLSVGDALFQRKCFVKMQEFFEGGRTLIYVSHDINSVNELCSRAIFLFEGSVLLDSDTRIVTNYYLKHIFSDNKDIRRDIEKISQEKQSLENKSEERSEVSNRVQGSGIMLDDSSTSFIPNFLPKTTLEYKNYDVDINELSITTLGDKKVNVLSVYEKYKIHYKVNFNINATGILFGFNIKNEKGVTISGEGVGLNEEGSSVATGDSVFIEKEFYCNLASGNYYMTVGVNGVINGERKSLSRIVDGLVFKVTKTIDNNFFGYYLLNGNMSAKKI
jgi:lipopolysaccharide transport system ATP-binding protein